MALKGIFNLSEENQSLVNTFQLGIHIYINNIKLNNYLMSWLRILQHLYGFIDMCDISHDNF